MPSSSSSRVATGLLRCRLLCSKSSALPFNGNVRVLTEKSPARAPARRCRVRSSTRREDDYSHSYSSYLTPYALPQTLHRFFQWSDYSIDGKFQSRKCGKFCRRWFSSQQKFFSSSPLPPSQSFFPTATTIEGLWRDSTDRLLDRNQTPVGSLDSLQWHLAETLVLYWSQTKQIHGTQTPNTSGKSSTANHFSPIDRFSRGNGSRNYGNPNMNVDEENRTDNGAMETMARGHQLALMILERLVEEKIAVATAKSTLANATITTGNHTAGDKDDFRTVDVSLIHAFLKHWKDCLHTINETKNNKWNVHHYARDRNGNRRDHERHGNPTTSPPQHASTTHSSPGVYSRNGTDAMRETNNNNNNIEEQQRGESVLLPSHLLQTLDGWVSEGPVSPTATVTPLFEPNIATYTLLMDGAVSCRSFHESAGFCEVLLERLVRESERSDRDCRNPHLRPTMVTLGTFFQGLANHKTIASAELAESWLRRIPSVLAPHDDGTVARPNAVVYTTVIRAWASLGRADRAEALLREMCHDYASRNEEEEDDDDGNDAAKPNLWTFNTVLAAWSRSRDPGAVQKAESLLRTMESLSSSSSASIISKRRGQETANDLNEPSMESNANRNSNKRSFALQLDVAPTIVSYNSLLSTIASRSRRPDSLARAETWMEEILAKAAASTAVPIATDQKGPRNTVVRQGHKGRESNRYRGKKKHDSSLAPNLITYRALFNIIAGAGHLSDSEKADRMRYWLARGTVSAPTRGGRSNQYSDGGGGDDNDDAANRQSLQNHPFLLEQIIAFEAKEPK